jgi:hypothetical protein
MEAGDFIQDATVAAELLLVSRPPSLKLRNFGLVERGHE